VQDSDRLATVRSRSRFVGEIASIRMYGPDCRRFECGCRRTASGRPLPDAVGRTRPKPFFSLADTRSTAPDESDLSPAYLALPWINLINSRDILDQYGMKSSGARRSGHTTPSSSASTQTLSRRGEHFSGWRCSRYRTMLPS
jgi:hypothetical protein